MQPPSFWVLEQISLLGEVVQFADGLYTVKRDRKLQELYHYELMAELSRCRQPVDLR